MTQVPDGVQVRQLTPHRDERGSFTELHRLEWDTGVAPVQWNAVRSEPGVLRGVHVHPRHDDYLVIFGGHATVGLSDLRPSASRDRRACCIDCSGDSPIALTIPHGVAHGFFFHEPVLHIYAVSHYWDKDDELGCHWTDAELQIPWPQSDAQVSDRDAALPSFAVLLDQLESEVALSQSLSSTSPADR
jgi:dTDP-4-dehydrorhamnose 3,5-epimerase